MFSNLASYIFGSSNPEEEATPTVETPLTISHSSAPAARAKATPRDESGSSEEDWVLVGGNSGHAPALGSLNDIMPRPPTGSTGSSATPSEEEFTGEEDMVVVEGVDNVQPIAVQDQADRVVNLTRSGRRLTAPFSCQSASGSLAQIKASRSAQMAKIKSGKRSNTAKATERRNKAVKNQPGLSKKSASTRQNLSIKSSGFQKQLKQC